MTTPEIVQEIEVLRQVLFRIDQRIEQLGALLSKDNKSDKVPNVLDFIDGEEFYCVDSKAWINHVKFNDNYEDSKIVEKHRAFKTLKYAEMFYNKTQFIADLLHFKWLYDKDFEPDWDSDEYHFRVVWRPDLKKYEVATMSLTSDGASVFFSTKEIARRCADWLNSRMSGTE